MPTVIAGPAGLDMNNLDLSVLFNGVVTTANHTTYQVRLPDGELVTFTGVNFSYGSQGLPTGGVVTGISNSYQGQWVYQATGLNVAVTDLVSAAQNGQTFSILKTALAGDDTLIASDHGGWLYGFDGNDSMVGGAGADQLWPGPGNNFVLGGGGNDTIVAEGQGSNTLYAGEGNDLVNGGFGANLVNGNKGDDTIMGISQVGDQLFGGQGNDVITVTPGSSAHNYLNGNLGNDTLTGGNAGDTIRGGQGDDSITGGDGPNWLSGDMGHDTLFGGRGADIFHVASNNTQTMIVAFDYALGDRILLDPGATYTEVQSLNDRFILTLNSGTEITVVTRTAATFNANWIIWG